MSDRPPLETGIRFFTMPTYSDAAWHLKYHGVTVAAGRCTKLNTEDIPLEDDLILSWRDRRGFLDLDKIESFLLGYSMPEVGSNG